MGKTRRRLVYLIAGFLCGLIPAILSIAVGEEGYLANEPAKLFFPTLIQVNATLIGFWGIILVYYLKVLYDERRALLTLAINMASRIEKLSLKQESLSAKAKQTIDTWSERKDLFFKGSDNLAIVMSNFTILAIFVIIAFLASIFVCVVSLSRIEAVGIETAWVYYSIVPFLFGVSFIFVGIWSASLDVREK